MHATQPTSQTRHRPPTGPAIFYGYHPESREMRMMDYSEYVNSLQGTYANVYSALTRSMQGLLQPIGVTMPSAAQHRPGGSDPASGRREDRSCGCHDDEEEEDCHCRCCIRDSDIVEYARCGELRIVPLTFENDTRRERDVKLALGNFATGGGRELGWETSLSETEFVLPPCGEKTVFLKVAIDCRRFAGDPQAEGDATVDESKVAYATIRAEGCLVRPIVVAVAVLPNDCSSYRVGCQCGCCC